MSLFQTDDEFIYQPFVDALETASLQIVQSNPPVYESEHKLPQNSSLTDISFYNKHNHSPTTVKRVEVLQQGHSKYGKYKPMQWTIETILEKLHTTNDGRYVLADAKKNNGFLSDEAQNILTQLLINHLFQDQSKGNDLFFRKISDLIVQVFPEEHKSVYFIPARSEGPTQTHAKGKLIERWKNVARRLRTVGAISSSSVVKNLQLTATDISFSEDTLAIKRWLANEGLTENFDVVLSKWQLTYELRKHEILNSSNKYLADLFESWPALQCPIGYELIVEDYRIGYPESHDLFKDFNCFLNSWEVFSTKLLKIRRSSIKDKYAINLLSNLDSAELNGNLKTANVIKLLLIPYLIPTKTLMKNILPNGKNKCWKPSLLESSSAFAYFCNNLTGLQEDIDKRQSKYSQYGATIQPYIIFVGKDLSSIDSSYIRVNKKLWCFDCPLKALEICFKSYFVFNCAYPAECYDSWLVIQQYLFKLFTKYDKSTSITTSVTSNLNS
ncbi:uncharacterized protein LOC100571824 isoform X2 [Acyrthosiphon pisum]|uniref:Uncharacterized protein n=1 Tax=Acyrthosiphon pisum TaxID=7029 RepID=A0A8R2D560_ACYPI|nr:uncharacterized protein LOC100571824 isoform X1 [Acyrthosiphon pisum]XP_016661384.1 uncharacterized protein LOC100571824 isoform X2 [Acyrthosiphon pisum]|eukprot:XP_016661383.1 PREDICTED: uncharacterized protein LOC100571824 isoform X1 [Acyrthosiphon pisum]